MPLCWFKVISGEKLDESKTVDIPHNYAEQQEIFKKYKGEFIILDRNHRLRIYKEQKKETTDCQVNFNLFKKVTYYRLLEFLIKKIKKSQKMNFFYYNKVRKFFALLIYIF